MALPRSVGPAGSITRLARRTDMTRLVATCAVALVAVLLAGTIPAWAQEQSKFPEWSGQWLRGPGMGNGWDPSKEQGHGQEAPLTSEYKAKFDAFLADKAAGGIGGDPTALCLPHGMPRMMIGIYPIEIGRASCRGSMGKCV